jgi:glucose/arabinose dehydrogenase
MRRVAALASVAALVTVALTACGSDGEDEPAADATSSPSVETPASPTESIPPSEEPEPPTGPAKVVDTIATGLSTPWGIAFLPDGDAIVTERDSTRVLLLEAPSYDAREVGSIDAAVGLGDVGGEAGLLGVAVSPSFDRDKMLFFYFSTDSDNRIVKAPLRGGRLGEQQVIVEGIPQGHIHDGGRLAFGPDGYLYASTGETGQPELAQDKGSPAGKILRMTVDGEPAPDNPFPGSRVWSYGHRNVQGLAFDDDGRLWASEFGDQTYDELNLIEAGNNYGWPMVEGRADDQGGGDGLTDPQVTWDTDEASPSGLAYLDGYLWLASLRGERLWRVAVDGAKAGKATDFFVGDYGRLRTVVAAPDGNLWLTTSNRDGRGDPAEQDDRILVVRP